MLAEWGIHLKRVGLEAFSFSAWLFTAVAEKGLPMICIANRHAKAALNAMLNKSAHNDAKDIAQIMRTGWFHAVHVKPESAQTLRALLVARKAMRGKVLDMENMIRGLLRPRSASNSARSRSAVLTRGCAISWPGRRNWKRSSRRCWTPAAPCGSSWQNCTA
ncbi:transposase [Bradyrhizobium sp. LA6.10]